VLLPDLYRGKLGLEAEEAHHLMSNLDWALAVEDIRGAARQLKAEGSAKVGITGFCMGGALSLAGVGLVEEIDAAAPFYGIPQKALCDPATIRKPVQGHFGTEDNHKGFSDPEAAAALGEALKAAGAEYEILMYPGVGHAFMNDSPESIERKRKLGQGEHDQAAVDLAWSRVFAFFGKHIGGPAA
jgi:carboxymethylenebutenolidase